MSYVLDVIARAKGTMEMRTKKNAMIMTRRRIRFHLLGMAAVTNDIMREGISHGFLHT